MTWLRNLSIRARTFLMVGLGLVIVTGLFGFLSVRAMQEVVHRVLTDRLRLVQMVAFHIDDQVAETLHVLERTAATEGFDLTDADPEPERSALRKLYRTGTFSCYVFVTDRRGIVLFTEPRVPELLKNDLSAQPSISAALRSGQPQVSSQFACPAASAPSPKFGDGWLGARPCLERTCAEANR